MTYIRWVVSIFMLGLAAQFAAAQASEARIEAAITAARAAATDEQNSNPSWKEFGPDLLSALERARAARESGRLYLALEELGRARTILTANHFAARAAKEGMGGFEKAWEAERAQRERVKVVSHRDTPTSPAVVLALVESAQSRSPTLLSAAKAYAGVTNAEAGFYYLGQSVADAEFAAAAPTFGLRATSKRLRVRSIANSLAALQARVNDAFRPPRSIDKHPAFIRLNAALKTATELNDAGYYYGALYHYLDATQLFSTLMASDTAAPAAEPLRAELTSAAGRLAGMQEDASVALLFVQRAQALLAPEKPEEAAVRRAAAIARDVLPAYENALKNPAAAPGSVARVVDVTLVRWPYT